MFVLCCVVLCVSCCFGLFAQTRGGYTSAQLEFQHRSHEPSADHTRLPPTPNLHTDCKRRDWKSGTRFGSFAPGPSGRSTEPPPANAPHVQQCARAYAYQQRSDVSSAMFVFIVAAKWTAFFTS